MLLRSALMRGLGRSQEQSVLWVRPMSMFRNHQAEARRKHARRKTLGRLNKPDPSEEKKLPSEFNNILLAYICVNEH